MWCVLLFTPGPVFVLSENWVAYKDKDWREIRAPLPRRSGLPPSRGVLPVAWTLVRSGGYGEPWVLLVQSEFGDLYAVTLEESGGEAAPGLRVVVVDSITRCSCLVSLHSGKVLWAVAECGDQMVYGMGGLVGQGVKGVSSSAVDDKEASGRLRDNSIDAAKVAHVFEPTQQPVHLQEVAGVNNMAPITSLRSVGGRLVAFCGGGRGSSMRVFTSGLPVSAEEAGKLPTRPTGMWTAEVGQVQYLIVGFESSTAVWRMVQKEGMVHFQTVTSEECVDIGFVTDARTIEVRSVVAHPICPASIFYRVQAELTQTSTDHCFHIVDWHVVPGSVRWARWVIHSACMFRYWRITALCGSARESLWHRLSLPGGAGLAKPPWAITASSWIVAAPRWASGILLGPRDWV